MKRVFAVLVIGFMLWGICLKAQTYTVPVNYKFNSAEDFKKYEAQVIETIQWLQITPWTEEPAKRRAAQAFLFKWIQGIPSMTIQLMPPLIDLTDKNNLLMASFMGGYTKYAIQHPNCKKEDANGAAVKALIAKYRAEPTHKKDDDVEQLIRLDREGKLEEWIKTDYEKPVAQ